MPSLLDLPTEVRLQIWSNILPDDVGVSMDEYKARTRVVFSPVGKPIVLHRVAYATTTAASLRVLNRQIYAEILSMPPPILCVQIQKRAVHLTIDRCGPLIRRSLRRIKILETSDPDTAQCLVRYFRDVKIMEMGQVVPYVAVAQEKSVTFAVSRPYSNALNISGPKSTRDRRCCDTRDRMYAWIEEEPDYSDGDHSSIDTEVETDGESPAETWELLDNSA